MDSLIGTHAVTRGSEDVGTLNISQNGNMTVFEFTGHISGGDSGVLRLAGVSRGGYVNIGVAAPEGGALKLTKSFSKSALRPLGLEPEMGFFLILAGEKFDAAPTPTPPEPVPEPTPEDMPEEIPKDTQEEPPDEMPEETPEEPAEEPPAKAEPPAPTDDAWSPLEDPSALFNDPDIAAACQNAKGALVKEKDGVTLLAIPVIAGTPFPMMPVFCFGDYVMIDGREYVVFKIKNGNFVM